MAGAEIEVKRKIRNSKIQRAILNSLYIAGALSVAVLMPNAASLLKYLDPNKNNTKRQKYSINSAISRLCDKGLIVWDKTEKGVFLRLTKEGSRTLELIERNGFKAGRPRKWDGKWRIIIFDIKDKRKGLRDKFRRMLMQIGFLKLQNSVWVFPYNCEELITMVKADFRIGKEILYIIADSIENDKWARKHFEL